MGTEKPKKNPSAHDRKENKLGPCLSMFSLLLGCMKFYFSNCLSPFFTWAIGRHAQYLVWAYI
jgi:uncharacterized Tic20 family protein